MRLIIEQSKSYINEDLKRNKKQKRPLRRPQRRNFYGPNRPYDPRGIRYLKSNVALAINKIKGQGTGWDDWSEWAVEGKPSAWIAGDKEIVFSGRFDAKGDELPAIKNVVAKLKKAEKEGSDWEPAETASFMLIGNIRARLKPRTRDKFYVRIFLRFVHAGTGVIAAAAETGLLTAGQKMGEAVESLIRGTLKKIQADFAKLFKNTPIHEGIPPLLETKNNDIKIIMENWQVFLSEEEEVKAWK